MPPIALRVCVDSPPQIMRGHSKGVVCLAYCPSFQYILSGSYDHDVIIWSPHVPVMLYKLKGHSLPIVSIRYVADTPQVCVCVRVCVCMCVCVCVCECVFR